MDVRETTADQTGQAEPFHDVQLVPVSHASEPARTILEKWKGRQVLYATSLDLTTTRGKIDLINARGADAGQLPGGEQMVIEVRDWLLHEVDLPDTASGEVINTLRLVVITPDGHTFATFSGPVVDQWRFIADIAGGKTFAPPINVTLKRRKGRSGFAYWQIASVELPEVKVSKLGK